MAHRYQQQSKKDGDQGGGSRIITPELQSGTSNPASSSGAGPQDRAGESSERQGSAESQARTPVDENQSSQESGQRRGSLPMAWPVSPFGMMNRMFEEMDRFFEDFGFGRNRMLPRMRDVVGEGQRGMGSLWSPQIEVLERDGQLVVCADLPGMRKEDVKVEVGEDALTIRGERREEQNRSGYSERFYGNFYRRIPLPEGANPAAAQARFQDGVLEVSVPMPKRDAGNRRQLEIR